MKISQFRVLFPSDSEEILMHEAWGLEYERKLFLVAYWLENKEKTLRKPGRLIRFDDKPHAAGPGGRWLVKIPIPKAVLDGTSRDGFETHEGEDIALVLPLPFPEIP